MARLACPPSLSRFAASVSTTAKPAVRRSVSQRAPIQSAASRTKTSSAQSSLIHLAASKTTMGAVSTALQHTRSARHMSAVTSKTYSGASIRAPVTKISVCKDTTNSDQKNVRLQTRIPIPKIVSKTHAKWTKIRQCVPLVYKTTANSMNEKIDHNALSTAAEFDGVEEEREGGDTIIEIDNNPDLLNDVSFDETLDRFQQSSSQSQLAKFELLSATIRQGGRTVKCPAYGGADSFSLERKRPRVLSVEFCTYKVNLPSKIPCKTKTTLKYGGKLLSFVRCWTGTDGILVISLATAAPTFTVEQTQSSARFGYGNLTQLCSALELDSPFVSDRTHLSTFDTVTSKYEEFSVPVPAPCGKVLRFHEDTIQPLLFDPEAPANDLSSVLHVEDGWVPLQLDHHSRDCSQATGFHSMFAPTSLQTLGIKHRVLARFKAVQEYEKRRKQESLAAGKHPSLGQLEYGNADFKLALQPTKVITVNDIGTLKDPRELGIPISTCGLLSGPLLHFGGFQDDMGRSFEDAQVPSATNAAYKKPIDWKQAPTAQASLHEWFRSNFATMQSADLAG
jgi:hypothetical protein